MENRSSRAKNLAAYLICIAFFIVGAVLFLRYLLGVLVPFLIAWGLALAVRPIAARISPRTRIPNRVWRLLLLMIAFALLSVGAWFSGVRLVHEAERLLSQLTEGDAMERISEGLFDLVSRLPVSVASAEQITNRILDETVNAIVSVLPGFIGKIVSSVPRLFIAAVVTLIAAVYFSLDLERIHAAVLRITPERFRPYLLRMSGGVFHIAAVYGKAYLLLMLVTAALLFVGFLIIGVDYALLLAFIIALVDLFPVLGVGTVLVPWCLWCLLAGNLPRALGLLALWGVTLVVRQFAEPRLLGNGLGVHPLLTLVLMFAGLSLGGIIGMLIAPVLAVPLTALIKRDRPSL